VISLFALGAIFAATAAIGVRGWLRSRVPAAEVELRRRETLVSCGKLTDGTLVDRRENTLTYSYDVRGVTYTAAQDVSTVAHALPDSAEALFGPVFVKYDPKNAANSIILAEDWSGFRVTHTRK
jgi:hypothetical protein